MDRILNAFVLNKVSFHTLSLRGRVVLTQLPLSATMLFLLLGVCVFHRPVLAEPLFQLSMLLNAVLLLLCFAVPWDRLPYPSFLVVPVLDFVPIGLLREGVGTSLTGAGLLATFPVIWLAASGQLPRLAVPLGTLLTLVMVWLPLFVRDVPLTADTLSNPLLVPFMMLAIGLTVQVLDRSMEQQKAELEAKDERLEGLLAQSAHRERLLHAIVEAVDVGVLAVDADGHDILMNRRQRWIHELALPDGVHDGAEADLLVYADGEGTPLPAEDRAAARAVRGESFSDYLVWTGRPPAQRVLSVSARPMHDEHGRPEGSVLAFNDVTDLVDALQAKDDFLAGVSHELRTPLTSIRGYTELLAMDDQLPGHVRSGLEVVERNADQLLVLVEDLLGTATRVLELQPVRTDLVQVVQQSAAAAELRAAEAGVDLRVEVPPRLELVCDPVRIGQVLDNLLSNAIKYSPGGGPVTVRVSPAGGAVQVQVADRGMGMRPEDAEHVFGRFVRSHNARMSAIPGLGLGLAVAREIVEHHGGTIRCESALGEGTVFTVTLPLDGPAAAPAAEREPVRGTA
ncbi:sensor histidine kinase [Kocuria sp.]|uniref:sensor histidine kinase n=1 Tax=Kocuria sp. TaxID=1871328 RepID=UPI002810FB25|nr:ATP-binding protein [Kocuria sp.]HST72095.1 ATP-binding protein [Kocuria rosea]